VKPISLLTASGISSTEVGRLLPDVDLSKVAVRRAPGWLDRMWGRDISAMTLRTTIYVRADVLDRDPATLGRLIVHELVHVQQWSKRGTIGFLGEYVIGYLRGRSTGLPHRAAYRAIPLEVEAREVANQVVGPIGPI
jgi:hypothetical protein